uniref:Carbonic anhydrase n=1 Tax=Amphora coffeiformis TaxID=265554 RepID=A0A7S3L4L4_9STRA|eukprot:scaffold756_cov158-Amphora_coffeaeformis.AAC.11
MKFANTYVFHLFVAIYPALTCADRLGSAQGNTDRLEEKARDPSPKPHFNLIKSQKKLERCHENEIYHTHMSETKNHLLDILQGEKEENPTLLWIGCSLDRYQIVSVCSLLGGKIERMFPDGAVGERAAAISCRSPHMNLGYVQIFGMHQRCNDEAADAVDPRKFDTEADHIRALLPELLEKMGSIPTHVQVGSNLWDLSPGCNNMLGIPESFQKLYVQGMHEMYEAVFEILPPESHISWRSGMPVDTSYSDMAKGRKLENQETLNRLVEQEVHGSLRDMGSFLDHWSVVRKAPTDCCMMKDGRHYVTCSSYAFFNNWLDAIYST